MSRDILRKKDKEFNRDSMVDELWKTLVSLQNLTWC